MTERQSEDLSGRLLITTLRRRVALIAACFTVVLGAVVGSSLLRDASYSASASIVFRDPQFDHGFSGFYGTPLLQDLEYSGNEVDEVAREMNVVPLEVVADRTAEEVDGVTGEQVDETIEVTREVAPDISEGSDLNPELAISLGVTATHEDPEFAAVLANSFAANYLQTLREANREVAVPSIGPRVEIGQARRLLQNQIAQLKAVGESERQVSALESLLEQLTVLASLRTGTPEAVRKARPPVTRSSPDLVVNAALGAVLALLLSAALAVLVERLGGGAPPEA